MSLRYLGDVLGSLRYLGQCFKCNRQFMSQRDMVATLPGGRLVCELCAVPGLRDKEVD